MKTIKDEIVDFKLALLLEKKGFPQGTSAIFYFRDEDNNNRTITTIEKALAMNIKTLDAPSHQRVIKWLREVYNIHLMPEIKISNGIVWQTSIIKFNDSAYAVIEEGGIYKSYEASLSNAIKAVLEKYI
jgi:hypothetical protein